MSEPSLHYLFAHLDSVGVTLRHPALSLLLLFVPGFVYLGRRTHRVALILRVAAFALLTASLAGLALTAMLPSDRLSIVAAVDVSDSIDETARQWQTQYLNQLSGALAPGDEMAVVAFAQDATVVRPPGAPAPFQGLPRNLPGAATDIGRGLDASLALFAPDTERRLVLLSDGLESRGDSRSKIARARRAGVHVFAAVPPHAVHRDVALERLTVAPVVGEGAIFSVRVTARNFAKAGPAFLTLYADGEALGTEPVKLDTGLNTIEIPYRMAGAGGHHLRAELRAPDDDIPGNNRRDTSVMVVGKTRALVVTADAHPALATVLERKGIETEVSPPARFPDRLDDLLSFHCVILEDVVAGGLDAKRLGLLERYVRDFGGALIFVGSDRSFGDPGFKRTPLEALLPVTLEPRRPQHTEREPMALYVLIDRSNSMGYNSRIRHLRDGEKMRYAREAALAVIRQLKDHDLVGVIAFDSQPFSLAPLRTLKENRAVLEETIPRLAEGGGTDFYDALDTARTQLIDSRVATKHIILLTDGDTNRAASDHYPLIDAIAQANISITTIRIGDDTVNLDFLQGISTKTGGQFYHVENVETLPELMLRDTSERLAQAPRGERHFLAQMGAPSQIMRGIAAKEVPALTGYAYSRLKPGAEAAAFVSTRERKDPLLADWQYGLGRVVAFTAGLEDDAETWVGWPGFGKLWSQVVHWSVREQTPWDYALSVDRREGQTRLSVRAFDTNDDGVLLARLHASEDSTLDIPLVPSAPRQFTGRLPNLPGGRYPLTVIKRRGEKDVVQRTALVDIPNDDEPVNEERFAPTPDVTLLSQLAEATGGTLNPPVRELVARKPGTRQLTHSLDDILIPLAMALFLADVAVRRMTQPPSGVW
ncbi:MAG TPA: VWA domain-containing protein [Candidatus Kryptonia bacterium]|nr:VWA domain-containing protein [Candidatus Kryptonia bacterium]